jgi:hypothetical protein
MARQPVVLVLALGLLWHTYANEGARSCSKSPEQNALHLQEFAARALILCLAGKQHQPYVLPDAHCDAESGLVFGFQTPKNDPETGSTKLHLNTASQQAFDPSKWRPPYGELPKGPPPPTGVTIDQPVGRTVLHPQMREFAAKVGTHGRADFWDPC